jgi:hypothetical protein
MPGDVFSKSPKLSHASLLPRLLGALSAPPMAVPTLACRFHIGFCGSKCRSWPGRMVQPSWDRLSPLVEYLHLALNASAVCFYDLFEYPDLPFSPLGNAHCGLPTDAPDQHRRAFIAYFAARGHGHECFQLCQ